MNRQILFEKLKTYIRDLPGNTITEDMAFSEEDIGKAIFDEPVMAIGRADDPLWEELSKDYAVGKLYKTPQEWLPGAKSVIAFFAPFKQHIIIGNRPSVNRVTDEGLVLPGTGWLTMYKYGGQFLRNVVFDLIRSLESEGYKAYDPYATDAFVSVYEPGSEEDIDPEICFTSNWSVRHAGYICGLGTFGISRGLITPRGMAGRLETVITTAEFEYDKRTYEGLYDYCIFCGKCAVNCPAGAIDMIKGKDHHLCMELLERVAEIYPGCDCCGKCQVMVPCERMIPNKKFRAKENV